MEYKDDTEFEEAVAYGRDVIRRNAGLSERQFTYTHWFIEHSYEDEQENAFIVCENFVFNYIRNIKPNGIMLVGPVGCGKTMFASYIINDIIDRTYQGEKAASISGHDVLRYQETLDYYYWRGSDDYMMIRVSFFLKSLRSFIDIKQSEMYTKSMDYLMNVKLLVLDDLGAEKSTDWSRSVLFDIIDYRYSNFLPIIITTNCLPDELKEKIGERSVDRLREMCKLVTINHGSFRKTAE